MTTIEWTDTVWNPVVGCSRVSAGCQNCYAERVAHRGMQDAHKGLTVLGPKGPRWTGEVRTLPARLGEPLRWRKPRRVFVNSMSDLFHEAVPFEFIAAVFGVMAACPQHTFQVLTKRPERARAFFEWDHTLIQMAGLADELITKSVGMSGQMARRLYGHFDNDSGETDVPWPLPNVWLGVSVEDQATADERIPLLLECPAAVRWVSYEPALGPVDFEGLTLDDGSGLSSFRTVPEDDGIDWIVVGGESGPGARPFDLAWARSTIAQCRDAGVACFVKQLGSAPDFGIVIREGGRALRDRKGGDMSEWPDDVRVREWPEVSR